MKLRPKYAWRDLGDYTVEEAVNSELETSLDTRGEAETANEVAHKAKDYLAKLTMILHRNDVLNVLDVLELLPSFRPSENRE